MFDGQQSQNLVQFTQLIAETGFQINIKQGAI